MKRYSMRWINLNNVDEAKRALFQIGSDSSGIEIMAGKAVGRAIKLEKIPLPVAHILKQEMLSLGGDVAVHRNVITGKIESTDALVLGTVRQLKKLAKKLYAQPFGLKTFGQALSQLLENIEVTSERILDCRGKSLTFGQRTLVMGILNLTPDSFSDGGKFFNAEDAIAQADRLVADGADILDIGAESTRPSYNEISAEEEWARLEPVIRLLVPRVKVPISIDTYKAVVAEKALQAGANIINDIWGLQRDPDIAKVAGEYQAPVVVMHNQTGTNYQCLMGDIIDFLRKSIEIAEEHGLSGDQIIVDPGIGFGKTTEQNLEVMCRLSEFKTLGQPILLGASRKSMIGNTLNLPVNERLEGTIATSVIAAQAGVDIVRVHDVKENKRAVSMADAILRNKRGTAYEGA